MGGFLVPALIDAFLNDGGACSSAGSILSTLLAAIVLATRGRSRHQLAK